MPLDLLQAQELLESSEEISFSQFNDIYNLLREKEIQETKDFLSKKVVVTKQSLPEGESWLLEADLTDPKFASMNLEKLEIIQATLRAGEQLILCEDCGEIYPAKGYWYICEQPDNFRHGHHKIVAKNAKSALTTVVYVNRFTGKVWVGDGSQRVPCNKDGSPIPGYERMEVRGWRERDKFYKMMDRLATQQYQARLEREDKMFEPLLSENRKQARQDILSSEARSPEATFGREWLAKMIKKTEDARSAKQNYSPNTYIDAWEWDSSNLDTGYLTKVNETLEEKQPQLKEGHKKAIGKALRNELKNKVAKLKVA